MLREYTCIMCPRGCDIQAELSENGELLSVTGNFCPKGKSYVTQELTAPMRNIATSVLVENGSQPLVSVRLTKPIPKERIFEAVTEIHKLRLTAPVAAGTVLIHGLLGTDSDVIATRTVDG